MSSLRGNSVDPSCAYFLRGIATQGIEWLLKESMCINVN